MFERTTIPNGATFLVRLDASYGDFKEEFERQRAREITEKNTENPFQGTNCFIKENEPAGVPSVFLRVRDRSYNSPAQENVHTILPFGDGADWWRLTAA